MKQLLTTDLLTTDQKCMLDNKFNSQPVGHNSVKASTILPPSVTTVMFWQIGCLRFSFTPKQLYISR